MNLVVAPLAIVIISSGIVVFGNSSLESATPTTAPTAAVAVAARPLLPRTLFPGSRDWSKPIAKTARTDPNSTRLVSQLAATLKHGAKGGPFLAVRSYAVPVWIGRSNDPIYKIGDCRSYACPGVPGARLHVPAAARPDPGGDHHIVLIDRRRHIEYDLFKARKSGHTWTGAGGARADYRSADASTGKIAGATAAHTALLAGLIRPEELRRGRINHALQMTVPGIGVGAPRCPANFNVPTSRQPYAPVEGTKFQLSPSFDVNRMDASRIAKTIARAMQRYGAIVVDNGGQVAFRAENPIGKSSHPWAQAGIANGSSVSLAGIPFTRLRVIAQPTC